MTKLTSLCVYCGARTGTDPAHRVAAKKLGALLGQNRIKLIFGAGRVGLMGVIADAALEAGGEVVGVIPHHLERMELSHSRLTEVYIVNSMHERKQRMFELADAFAVLPGGLGTLDETLEIVTWRQLHLHHMPVILVDSNNYWKPLIDLVDHLIAQGFADPAATELFTVVNSVEDIVAKIETLPQIKKPAPAEYL